MHTHCMLSQIPETVLQAHVHFICPKHRILTHCVFESDPGVENFYDIDAEK